MATRRETISESDRWLLAASILFGCFILAAIFCGRCLFADGAHQFIRTLEARDFVSFMHSRHFAFYVYEWPLVLAIRAGVVDWDWLRWCFGLGCFLPWPLALYCCWRMARQHFWLVAMACGAGYLNAAAMPVGEHIYAHALFWPALFALLFVRPLNVFSGIVLFLCATGLMFSCESQIVLCALLAVLAVWRSVEERQSGGVFWRWVIFAGAAAVFAAGSLTGIFSVLMPELPKNFAGFRSTTLGLFGHFGWTGSWTIAWLILLLAALASAKILSALKQRPARLILFAAVMLWGTWPILVPTRHDLAVQFDNRSLNLLVPVLLAGVALLLRRRPAWFVERRELLVLAAALLLGAQSLWQLSATALWQRDVFFMRETLSEKKGVVRLHGTVLAANGMIGRDLRPDAMGGRFDWAWPCLSLALAPQKEIRAIICSEVFLNELLRRSCWQPFDPLLPATFPRLEHYGLDYDTYFAEMLKTPW